jgi:O-6-methylguanine DNA methyltransferase
MKFRDELKADFHSIPNKQEPKNLKKQFDLYFAGKLREFSCPLDLDIGEATVFQKKTWRKLLTIPYGSTRSYEWLAKAIGNAKAYRAAGNANGQNPLPIIIPCHRIVRKNGDLGGYTGGTHIKHFLLELEKSHASL